MPYYYKPNYFCWSSKIKDKRNEILELVSSWENIHANTSHKFCVLQIIPFILPTCKSSPNVEISIFTKKQLSFTSLYNLNKILCEYNNLPLSFVTSSLVSSRAWMTHIWWPVSHWQDRVWDTLMSNTYKNNTTLRELISSKRSNKIRFNRLVCKYM